MTKLLKKKKCVVLKLLHGPVYVLSEEEIKKKENSLSLSFFRSLSLSLSLSMSRLIHVYVLSEDMNYKEREFEKDSLSFSFCLSLSLLIHIMLSEEEIIKRGLSLIVLACACARSVYHSPTYNIFIIELSTYGTCYKLTTRILDMSLFVSRCLLYFYVCLFISYCFNCRFAGQLSVK